MIEHRKDNVRKAAILVASLDGRLAEQLLRRLAPSIKALVREAVESLREIDPAEQREVIDEFFRIGPIAPEDHPEGVELDGTLVEMLRRTNSSATGQQASMAPSLQPFRFLNDADVPSLVPFLEKERPQTVAVVLSYLPPDRAAQILTTLHPTLQVEVIGRLADLDTADTESLRVVERELESWVREQSRQQKRRMDGLATAQGIVSAAGSLGEQIILENLRRHDHRLASRIGGNPRVATQPPAVRWEDLAGLDDAILAAIVDEADAELVMLALAGADERLAERILRQLPKHDADLLASRIDRLGPTRLSDVEAAQQELVALAARLTDGRETVLPASRLTIAG